MAKLNKKAADMLKGVVGFLNDNPNWLWDNYTVGNNDFRTWLGTAGGRSIAKMLGNAADVESAARRLGARMTGQDKPEEVADILAELD